MKITATKTEQGNSYASVLVELSEREKKLGVEIGIKCESEHSIFDLTGIETPDSREFYDSGDGHCVVINKAGELQCSSIQDRNEAKEVIEELKKIYTKRIQYAETRIAFILEDSFSHSDEA